MTGVGLTKRGFLVIMILFLSFLSWYLSFFASVLQNIAGSSTNLIVGASFSFVIAITLLISSFFINRFSRIRLIYGYSIATSLASVLLLVTSSSVLRLIIVFAVAIFFGVGLLAFFTYFWSLTASVERGRVSGLAGFFALPFASVVTLMAETSGFSEAVIVCVILSLAPLAIRFLNPENRVVLNSKRDEIGFHPEKRTILLYSVPWILFSLINATLARNISLNVFSHVPASFYIFLLVLQATATGFGALGGGLVSDLVGRRLTLGFCLTLYGISTALGNFLQNFAVLSFVYFTSGLNWGILLTQYGSVVWGDLADKESCPKRYAFGWMIYFLTFGIGILFSPQVSQIPLIVSSLGGCFLIFISNVPLVLAPEVLSADFREQVKLKLHIHAVKRTGRKQSQN